MAAPGPELGASMNRRRGPGKESTMDGMSAAEVRRRYRALFGIDCQRAPGRAPDTTINGKGYYKSESGQYWSPADGNGRLIPIQGARQQGRIR